jgi:hypothetical protein
MDWFLSYGAAEAAPLQDNDFSVALRSRSFQKATIFLHLSEAAPPFNATTFQLRSEA